jgi:hypothetical protein
MPPPEEPVRRDPRVPAPEDDGTFGLDLEPGCNEDEDDGRAGSDPSTWTRLDPPVPGCVIYPHGFSVRYRLNLPLEQRLAALTQVRWSPGLAPDWRQVGRRYVIRGSVYLTQRAPRFRGRTRWSPLARFNSARHTALYHIGIQHTTEDTFVELQGVRWTDVATFFEQILQVGTGAVSVCHFLNLERYIVLPQDRAFALAEKHGFIPVGGRAAYTAKAYLIEKVEIPVRVRTRATAKVIISLYRIDRGATSDFKLEARLRGRRRDAQQFTEADCRLLDNILLAFVEDNDLEATLKPARWEPRDRRSRSESSPVDPDTFGDSQSPEPTGWARVQPSRPLDRRMFLARVVGQSMEDGISNGSWCVFRMYPAGTAPSPTALDGKRVIVQLRDETDTETGGKYTLKRWRVAQLGPDGAVVQIELRPDNPNYKAKKYTAKDGDLRAVAEFIEVVS